MPTKYEYGSKFRVLLPEAGDTSHIHCLEMKEMWVSDTVGVPGTVYYDIRVQDGTGYEGNKSGERSAEKVCDCEDSIASIGEVQFESWKIYKRFHRIWEASAMKETMPFIKFYLLSISSDVVGNDYTDERPDGYNNDWASSDEENLGVNE